MHVVLCGFDTFMTRLFLDKAMMYALPRIMCGKTESQNVQIDSIHTLKDSLLNRMCLSNLNFYFFNCNSRDQLKRAIVNLTPEYLLALKWYRYSFQLKL